MGILTDAFIATEAEVAAADFAHKTPSQLFPTIEAKRITTLELGKLHSIVVGQDLAAVERDIEGLVESLERDFPCMRDMGAERGEGEASDGPWVHRFPDTLTRRLAQLTAAESDQYGAVWARIEELGGPGATAGYIASAVEYLGQLCQLCVRARRENKNVYMWISL